MKLKTYAQKITPLMVQQGLITNEEEDLFADYINNTFEGEEFA